MPDVSIIIVNYKMKADIEQCLRSLYQDSAGSSYEVRVVVVDNHSEDGIEAWLKETYPQVTCIPLSENAGFGKAQNIGMKALAARYYFILNPDTVFLPSGRTIHRLVAWMDAHPKVGMVGPKIVYPNGALQSSCWRFPHLLQPLFSRSAWGKKGKGKKISDRFHMADWDHNRTQPVDCLMGSALFVRVKATETVGLFDEQYWMYFEDIDWCRRMWDAGWPVYYVHDVTLQHTHSRGSAKVPGLVAPLFKNSLARVHLVSWLKYVWKWRFHSFYDI